MINCKKNQKSFISSPKSFEDRFRAGWFEGFDKNQSKGHGNKSLVTGFTLIEIMIVIAIIGIFSVFAVVNINVSKKNAELNKNALLFLSYLEQAQTKALSGETLNGAPPLAYGLVLTDSFNFDGKPNYNCSLGCLYAVTSGLPIYLKDINDLNDGVTVLVTDKILTQINFRLPRANPEIILDSQPAVSVMFKIAYKDIFKCVEVNRVSGRMEALSCL